MCIYSIYQIFCVMQVLTKARFELNYDEQKLVEN